MRPPSGSDRTKPPAPNFVLNLAGDQGWSQVSSIMDSRASESHLTYLETPNRARLMREGRRFRSGWSPVPLFTPTHFETLLAQTYASDKEIIIRDVDPTDFEAA